MGRAPDFRLSRRRPASQEVPPFNYAEYAQALGLRGIRIERPEAIGPSWDQALSADRPVVIDAVTDPNVPPLPPHITIDQARAFLKSMLGGDAGAAETDVQGFDRELSAAQEMKLGSWEARKLGSKDPASKLPSFQASKLPSFQAT